MRRPTFRAVLPIGIVAATLATFTVTPAQARPEGPQPPAGITAAPADRVSTITDRLAHTLATAWADRAIAARISPAVADRPVDLATVTADTRLAGAVRAANQRVLAAKGLPADAGSLLRLRLAHEDMRPAFTRGVTPLLATTPNDDTMTPVTGYDPAGGTVLLDPVRIPARPVLLVEVDTAKALPIGLAYLRSELARRGLGAATVDPGQVTASGGYWATKVTAVRLNDDEEPWVKGAAEIYNLVAGFGFDGKAKVDLVQMPYLDKDGRTYYPNQLLVHYSAYKYNLADVVMMEDDGDTNYQQLVQAIANALLTIIDAGRVHPAGRRDPRRHPHLVVHR